MRFHLSQMKPFFHPLGQKLSLQLSCQTTKPGRHAIVSVVAIARAEAAPTKSHALDVESLKVRRQFECGIKVGASVRAGTGERASRAHDVSPPVT